MIDLIALNITNLTDARYFAARGAKYIFYRISSREDIPKVHLLQDWVMGPGLGIEIDTSFTPQDQSEIITEINPDAVLISDDSNSDRIRIGEEEIRIAFTEDLDNIQSEVYLYKEQWNSKEISQIKNLHIKGIAFQGTSETKVGFKDYDTIDKVIDEIERINSEEAI